LQREASETRGRPHDQAQVSGEDKASGDRGEAAGDYQPSDKERYEAREQVAAGAKAHIIECFVANEQVSFEFERCLRSCQQWACPRAPLPGLQTPALDPLMLHSAQPSLHFARTSLARLSLLHSASLVPAGSPGRWAARSPVAQA